jgi:hypothetical protein
LYFLGGRTLVVELRGFDEQCARHRLQSGRKRDEVVDVNSTVTLLDLAETRRQDWPAELREPLRYCLQA